MTSPLPKNMAIIFSQISINNSHWPVNSQINSQQKHSTVTPPTKSKKKKEIQLKIIATHYYQCFHFGCYKLESRDRIWKSTSCCRTSYSVFCLCGLYCFWAAIFLYTRMRKHIKPKSDPARRFYGRFLTWERVMIMCSVCFRLLFKGNLSLANRRRQVGGSKSRPISYWPQWSDLWLIWTPILFTRTHMGQATG